MNRAPIPLPVAVRAPTTKKRHRLSASHASDLAHAAAVLARGGRHVDYLASSDRLRVLEFRAGPATIERLRQLLKEHKACELCRRVKLVQLD